MRKTIVRVICLILLIPVLGCVLPFGSAHIYGKIRYSEKKSTVVSILDAHENELFEIMEDHTAIPKITNSLKRMLDLSKTDSTETSMLEKLGFAKLMRSKNNCFFQLPYDGNLGSWVPCGLLYSHDLSAIESWQKTSPIRGNWYFYWEP